MIVPECCGGRRRGVRRDGRAAGVAVRGGGQSEITIATEVIVVGGVCLGRGELLGDIGDGAVGGGDRLGDAGLPLG